MLLFCALLAAAALVADTLAWIAMEQRIGRRVEALAAQAALSGWRWQASSRIRGGWPFAATLSVMAPSLQGPTDRGRLTWTAEQATLRLDLLHPHRVGLQISGMQSLASGIGAARSGLWLQGDPMQVALPWPLDASQPIGFASGREQGAVSLPGGRAGFRLHAAHGSWRRVGNATAASQAITVSLHDIRLCCSSSNALGTADLTLQASITAASPAAAGAVPRRGRLLVSQAMMRWPDATLQASGQAAFGRPEGTGPQGRFSLRLTNPTALLARLVRSGAVTRSSGDAINAVLGLIAAGSDTSARAPGDAASITLPITVEAGMVRLGEIPLLRLPAFDPRPPEDEAAMP